MGFDKHTHIAAPLKVFGFKGGAAGAHTVTGITLDDKLCGVVGFLLSGALIETVHNLTSEFSITAADTIDNTGGTDTTSAMMFCLYDDWDA